MVQSIAKQLKTESLFHARYDNFIGGKWVAPVKRQYSDNLSPVTGKPLCQVSRSTAEDVDLALDAAHAARYAWARTSVTERSQILLRIADRMESNLDGLAQSESWDNGKPIRETTIAQKQTSTFE